MERIALLGVVFLLTVACFAGFFALGRRNRRIAARIMAAANFAWLAFLIYDQSVNQTDASTGTRLFIIFQVIYTVAGIAGWCYGTRRRGRMPAPRCAK